MNLITTPQAAALLDCHVNSAVRILDDARVQPAAWIGKARAYSPEAVERIAAKRRRIKALDMIRSFRRLYD